MTHIHEQHVVHSDLAAELDEPPVTLSHVVHAIGSYRYVIFLSWAAVALLGAIVILGVVLSMPSGEVTSLPFRLQFTGVEKGEYPSGLKFSPSDIVTAPVLLKAFNAGHLERFTNFQEFSQSVFVLESSPAYDALAAEYQARLADPRLTTVDRERIENEFSLKKQSVRKGDYAISYVRGKSKAPDTVIKKALTDILNFWASTAMNEQHALEPLTTVLTPNLVEDMTADPDDYVTSLHILRSRIYRVIDNIDALAALPGAWQMKSGTDHMSLHEVRIRLDEIVRFRVEPLVREAAGTGNRTRTLRFLQDQVAFDRRALKAAQDRADAARQALAAYALDQRSLTTAPGGTEQSSKKEAEKPGSSETVMPQLSDSFLDRLVALTSHSADAEYRQKLVNAYRAAIQDTVPIQEAVDYDTQILANVQSGGNAIVSPAAMQQQITNVRNEVRQLIRDVDEIYAAIARNLNPSTQLFAITAPATTRVERAVSRVRLLEYYALILLVALPVIVTACLIHHRVREEDQAAAHA